MVWRRRRRIYRPAFSNFVSSVPSSGGGGGGITIVQRKVTEFTTTGDPAIGTIAFDAGIASGSVIVFGGYTDRISYAAQTAGGQTHTDANLPSQVNGVVGDGNSMQSFIGAIFAPAAGQTTVQFTTDLPGTINAIIVEVAGLASPAFDKVQSTGGTGTTASSGSSGTLTNANEFLIGIATAQDDVFDSVGAGGWTDEGGENSGFFNKKFGTLIVSATTAKSFDPVVHSSSLFRSSLASVKG